MSVVEMDFAQVERKLFEMIYTPKPFAEHSQVQLESEIYWQNHTLPTHAAFRRDRFGWHLVEVGSNWLKRKYNRARWEDYFTVQPIRKVAQVPHFRGALLNTVENSHHNQTAIEYLIDDGVIW